MHCFISSLENDDPAINITGEQKLAKAIVHTCIYDLDKYHNWQKKPLQVQEKSKSRHYQIVTMMNAALQFVFPQDKDSHEWVESIFDLADYDLSRYRQYIKRNYPWARSKI